MKEGLTVAELVQTVKNMNASTGKLVTRNEDGKPTMAVIVLHGEHTSDILNAMEQKEDELGIGKENRNIVPNI